MSQNPTFDLSAERIIRARLPAQYPDVQEEFWIQYNKQNKTIDGDLNQDGIYRALRKSGEICNLPPIFVDECIEDSLNHNKTEEKDKKNNDEKKETKKKSKYKKEENEGEEVICTSLLLCTN